MLPSLDSGCCKRWKMLPHSMRIDSGCFPGQKEGLEDHITEEVLSAYKSFVVPFTLFIASYWGYLWLGWHSEAAAGNGSVSLLHPMGTIPPGSHG
jgi:hypothetical protein